MGQVGSEVLENNMSKNLYFESIGGASGDMILGSLIGLGVNIDELINEIQKLDIDNFKISVENVVIQGISGVRASVDVEENSDHHGRHLSTIINIINNSSLNDDVKDEAIKVFKIIGEAEASIHNIDIEKIHFHEVGAMDSIVDIVGCCIAKNKLGIDKVGIRSLPSGYGTIECAHGTYPNPAPATSKILEGFPVEAVDEPFELVTPTGAALLSLWRSNFSPDTLSLSKKISYSFGQRKLNNRPNLLRTTLYEGTEDETSAKCEIIECNIDDSTPELIAFLTEKLFSNGALDVFTQSIMMKKQRSGILLSVLVKEDIRDKIIDIIFKESSTFGLRFYNVERNILDRSFKKMDTDYGMITMKIGRKNNEIMSVSPEIEECKVLAEKNKVSVEKVYRAALSAWENKE